MNKTQQALLEKLENLLKDLSSRIEMIAALTADVFVYREARVRVWEMRQEVHSLQLLIKDRFKNVKANLRSGIDRDIDEIQVRLEALQTLFYTYSWQYKLKIGN